MTLTYESVNKDGDEDGDLKEVFRPMLPHVPMEVRASIVEDLCEDVEDERDGGLVTNNYFTLTQNPGHSVSYCLTFHSGHTESTLYKR